MSAPTLWPAPGETDTRNARRAAIVYRTHLHTANREMCDRVDDAMISIGQTWVVPRFAAFELDSLVEVADASIIAGVDRETVHQWRKRGYIDREGKRAHLQVRGLSESGAYMYMVSELLEIADTMKAKRTKS